MVIDKETQSYAERKKFYDSDLAYFTSQSSIRDKNGTRKIPDWKKRELSKKYFTKQEINKQYLKAIFYKLIIIMSIVGFFMYSCDSDNDGEKTPTYSSSSSSSSPRDSRFKNKDAEKNYHKFLDNQKNWDGSKFDTTPMRGY